MIPKKNKYWHQTSGIKLHIYVRTAWQENNACLDDLAVYRNSFGAQWTELQEQRPYFSASHKNKKVTAEW